MLDDWQREVLDVESRRKILNTSRQIGKALHVDTPIPTPDGWTSMGDLWAGDTVFDERGQICEVEWCSPIMERSSYKVLFSDGSEIVADEDHLWTTLDAKTRAAMNRRGGMVPEDWATASFSPGKITPSVKTEGAKGCSFPGCNGAFRAKGLCTGHYTQQRAGGSLKELEYASPMRARTMTTAQMRRTAHCGRRGDTNHSIPTTVALDLPESDLPIDPYVLGAWLGDGYSSAGCITVGEPDTFISEEIGRAGYRVRRRDASLTAWAIYGLAPILRELGALNNKHIPDSYLRASAEQRLALLQGLMDTDGSVYGSNHCEFTTTSPRLAEGFYELAVSLGLAVCSKQEIAKLDGREIGPKWRLHFSTPFVAFRLPRKVARQTFDGPRQSLRKLRYVVGIEPVGTQPVRCIAVSSPSKLYLAGKAMVPTHNSSVVSMLCLHKALYTDESLVTVYAPTEKQAKETFAKISRFYMALGNQLALGQNLLSGPGAGRHAPSRVMGLLLPNGSRIEAMPATESSARSFSADLAVIDEAAYCSDAFYVALTPTLMMTEGDLVLASTPNGKRGFFYEEWERREEEEWDWHEVPWYGCERLKARPDDVKRAARNMSPRAFRQEYETSFEESDQSVFRDDVIRAAFDTNIDPLWPDFDLRSDAYKDHYGIGTPEDTEALIDQRVWDEFSA